MLWLTTTLTVDKLYFVIVENIQYTIYSRKHTVKIPVEFRGMERIGKERKGRRCRELACAAFISVGMHQEKKT